MTEENKTKEVPGLEDIPAKVFENMPVQEGQGTSSSEVEHKPSNLRRRWKRNVAATGTATIKEDDAKLPKEIKTVKIESAELLNNRKDSGKCGKNHEKCLEKPKNRECRRGNIDKKCCCSCWCKVKGFILKLFGCRSKEEEQHAKSYRRGYRNRSYRGSRRQNFHNRKS